MSEILTENASIISELIGLFFITILITGLVVYTDIRIFDDYVGLSIEVCYAQNTEPFCVKIRERLDLPEDAQIEIGNSYWELLMVQMIALPVGFAGFRLLTVLVRKRKLNDIRIFVILLWGLIPLILFMSGIIDVFYYVGRGIEIPDQLEWLNNVGLFEYTKQFGIDPINVEKSDLLLTFGLGVMLIVLLFFFAVKLYENSGLRGFA